MSTILVSVRYDGKTYYNPISIDYAQDCLDDCIAEYALGNITAYHVGCELPAGLTLPEYGASEQGYGITIGSLGEGWLLPVEAVSGEIMSIQKSSIVYVATITNLNKISTMGNYTTVTVVSPANMGLTEFEKLLLDNYGHFCTWSSADIKRLEVIDSKVSLVKTKPAQKTITKNGVVCSIAAKLSKQGVSNPMQVAWKIYRLTLDCLHAISKKCYFDFYATAYQLECILLQHRFNDISQVLPASVCAVFKKHALSLTI